MNKFKALCLLGAGGLAAYACVGYGYQANAAGSMLAVDWLEIAKVVGGAVVLFLMGKRQDAFTNLFNLVKRLFGYTTVTPVSKIRDRAYAAIQELDHCMEECGCCIEHKEAALKPLYAAVLHFGHDHKAST